MSADKWVAVPRGLTQGMADNVPVGPDRLPLTEAYEFMLAARPTGPDVPVLVDRAEWEAMQTRVRELEERDRKLMSKLGQFKPVGNVQLDALLLQPDPAFEAFRDSLPETYWARYDLSAVRLGWHHGRTSARPKPVSETAAQGSVPDALQKFFSDWDSAMLKIGGCSDGGCMIDRPKGMHTNGGCKCWDDRTKARQYMSFTHQIVRRFRAAAPRSTETGR